MIKGLLAIFSSGIILNPMVLLGIFSGFYFTFGMLLSDIYGMFKDVRIYALALIIAAIYVLVLKIIIRKSANLKISDIFSEIMTAAFRLVLACILTILFIVMIGGGDFGDNDF